MKISNILGESESTLLLELRTRIANVLSEAIDDYLQQVTTILANKKHEEVFDPKKPLVDLEELINFVTGLKIIANPTYRQAMTDKDIGINPNNYKQLFTLLDSIPKDGKTDLPKATVETFNALVSLSSSLKKETSEKLMALRDGDEAGQQKALSMLKTLQSKTAQLMSKLKSETQKAASSAANTDQALKAAA